MWRSGDDCESRPLPIKHLQINLTFLSPFPPPPAATYLCVLLDSHLIIIHLNTRCPDRTLREELYDAVSQLLQLNVHKVGRTF